MMTTIEVQLAKICILSNIVVGFNNIFYYFFRQFFRLHSNLYITLDFFSINRNNKIITSIMRNFYANGGNSHNTGRPGGCNAGNIKP